MIRLERLPTLRINPSQTCALHYNGKTYPGVAGDTVATTLYANGVRIFGRSLKYHRPRGLYSLDGECSNTCMAVDGIPNVRTENTLAKSGDDRRRTERCGLGRLRLDGFPGQGRLADAGRLLLPQPAQARLVVALCPEADTQGRRFGQDLSGFQDEGQLCRNLSHGGCVCDRRRSGGHERCTGGGRMPPAGDPAGSAALAGRLLRLPGQLLRPRKRRFISKRANSPTGWKSHDQHPGLHARGHPWGSTTTTW